MAQFHTLTIKDIKRETEAAVSISFNIPESLRETYNFKAGQYITLKALIDGNEVRRDYSLCVSPNSHQLKVTVKEVENGTFSTYANQKLKVGDALEVSPPNGRFIFEPDSNESRNIIAFAAGSGITPVMSILKTVLENEPNSSVYLVYGNKSVSDTIFYKELANLQNSYSEKFHQIKVFSRANEEGALFGRIDTSTINYVLNNKFKDVAFDLHYLCGPEEMINSVRKILQDQGVPQEKVLFELFTASVTPVETTLNVAEGETEITVIVDDEESSFTMQQSATILEAALNEGLDAPYSCQGGVCSSCIARITEGAATMRQNNILTDGELAEGLILTCQAQPTTPKIVIDYDDV